MLRLVCLAPEQSPEVLIPPAGAVNVPLLQLMTRLESLMEKQKRNLIQLKPLKSVGSAPHPNNTERIIYIKKTIKKT